VTSAHKGPDETLRIKAEYEGDGSAGMVVSGWQLDFMISEVFSSLHDFIIL